MNTQDPYAIPLEQIDVSDPYLFQQDVHWGFFERLRKEAPVHYCPESKFGPYWSVTKFNDIMAVEKNHDQFSSEEGITLGPPVSVPEEVLLQLEPKPSLLTLLTTNQ